MSKVADFYQKAVADAAAKAKLDQVLGGAAIEELTDAQLQEIGKIAKELGFDITLEEAKAYLKSIGEELSDDVLSDVAGGGNITNNHCKGKGSYVEY